MVAAATTVTGARQLLLDSWPDFAAASNKSNKQVVRNSSSDITYSAAAARLTDGLGSRLVCCFS